MRCWILFVLFGVDPTSGEEVWNPTIAEFQTLAACEQAADELAEGLPPQARMALWCRMHQRCRRAVPRRSAEQEESIPEK